jgi:hypothetical protein
LHNTDLETDVTKEADTANDRVRLEDGHVLQVGSTRFSSEDLKMWKTWSLVERECKRLDPMLTVAEMDVIESSAAHLGAGARNGLTELKSAMLNSALAKLGSVLAKA